MAWRFHVRRATTGEWLTRDLPLQNVSVSFELSAVGSLEGTISPDMGQFRTLDGSLWLDPWNTLIYLEDEGVLRWGGVLVGSSFQGADWKLEAAQLSTYPHGMPYLGADVERIGVDPADMVRLIWAHLQSYRNGDLGVQVVGSSSARIGTERRDVSFDTGSGTAVEFETGPYELLWWENVDCGREIDSLASQAPFEWVEECAWDGEDVKTTIRVADRLGVQRNNLRFVMGENIVSIPSPEFDGDEYANEVTGVGAGEGKRAPRSTAVQNDGRLRRAKFYAAKGVKAKSRLDAFTALELRRSAMAAGIGAVEIENHRNAPFGSFHVGDSVQIDAVLPHIGKYSEWHRIVGFEWRENSRAILDLERLEVA